MTTDSVSRRGLLRAGAAISGAVAAGQVLGAGKAAAVSRTPVPLTSTTTYDPNPYADTPLPSPTARHYMSRLGCGFGTATFAQMTANGGPASWLTKQLSPSTIAESTTVTALSKWFPDLYNTAAAKWTTDRAKTKTAYEYSADLASVAMLRRIYSTRQVLENMVAFWSDVLHVDARHDTAWVWRADYDSVIRAKALGKFEDLLVACELHPAMLLYLDNYRSVKDAPNENQGRELLELHTVGRGAGYTEDMVKDSAKILSGYTVVPYTTWAGAYDPQKHTTGAVKVLGFTDANAAADGSALAVRYLKYLARHPATATNIATKLARHFVADQPSADLVAAVAAAYTKSGTNIKSALKALVAHPDFLASAGRLVRNPYEDLVATVRSLGAQALDPITANSFARACIYSPVTTLPFQWPNPAGQPLGDAAWCSAGRMLASFKMHWNLAGGYYPSADVTYKKTGADWLPIASIRLDQYVDHLCRVMLGKASDSRLVTAVVDATGYDPATIITKDHAVATWLHIFVMAALLDSPDHMCR